MNEKKDGIKIEKICMILDKNYPPDIRVEKEIRSLTRKGFEVHVLCVGEKRENIQIDNIIIHRIAFNPKTIKGKIFNISHLYNVFYNNIWKDEILKLHNEENFAAFHAHDLTTAPYSLDAGKKVNIPVILDLHENLPQAILAYRANRKTRITDLILWNSKIYSWIEQNSISKASHIITVVEERKNQLIKQGFNESKISVISNLVDINYLSNLPIIMETKNQYNEKFIVTYVGGFGTHRGVDTLIKAIPLLKNRIQNLLVLLVGGSISKIDELNKLCKQLNVDNYLKSIDWVNFNEIPTFINLSDICVVPHKKSGHTDTTIPHKLFQYMYFGKPVIVTDCIPMKRVIKKCECGIIVPSEDHEAMAEAIFTLYNDKELLKKYGNNSKNAAINEYDWEKNDNILMNIYKKIISKKAK